MTAEQDKIFEVYFKYDRPNFGDLTAAMFDECEWDVEKDEDVPCRLTDFYRILSILSKRVTHIQAEAPVKVAGLTGKDKVDAIKANWDGPSRSIAFMSTRDNPLKRSSIKSLFREIVKEYYNAI